MVLPVANSAMTAAAKADPRLASQFLGLRRPKAFLMGKLMLKAALLRLWILLMFFVLLAKSFDFLRSRKHGQASVAVISLVYDHFLCLQISLYFIQIDLGECHSFLSRFRADTFGFFIPPF